MRKKIFILFIFLTVYRALQAQKEDYIWIIGDSNTPLTTTHGGMIIDFNHPSPMVTYRYREVDMGNTNTSISNANGELLFYTNGCVIADSDDQIIENGDSINPGVWHDRVCNIPGRRAYGAGHPSAVILPLPGNDSIFYLFHKSVKYIEQPVKSAYVDRLLYTIIKITPEKKTVLAKNVLLLERDLSAGELLAVKHANGTDWWIVTPLRNSNRFYVFLFTKDGIVSTQGQTIGEFPPLEEERLGQSTFSPDGRLLVRYFAARPPMLYDFDRTTGRFSNYRKLNIRFDEGLEVYLSGGCAISPSNQYLYIMAERVTYQFDLWADDVAATQVKVGEWDGVVVPIACLFGLSQLGPDCKIYISCADLRYYHVIHQPDKPGLACQLEQRGLPLVTPSGASIPYFPNYRLGPIDNPGIPCVPRVSISEGQVVPYSAVQAWPNPASEVLYVRYPQHTEVVGGFYLYNAVGQVVGLLRFEPGSGVLTLPVGHLPSGMYYYVTSSGHSGKVLIKH